MGSCVSKKAARAGTGARGKVAAPLPVVEKESTYVLPPVAEAEEEEVKEVVLSEMPAPRPPPEPVKRRQEQPEPEEETTASEACSASDSASMESATKDKDKAKAKPQKAGAEREAEKRADDAPKKGRAAPEERESKPRGGAAGNGRARSPSPSSAHRSQQPGGGQQQQHHPPAPRPRREHPPVVSGIGCRSGRFSPSAARRAAESAVRRTHSAREADMSLPSKRSLSAAINGNVAGYGGGGALSRRDPGERSGRRSDSPTGRRASPSATHRAASPIRKVAKEHGTPERARPWDRDGDEQPTLAGLGGERKKMAEGEDGALGQNPSVAMECFIFL